MGYVVHKKFLILLPFHCWLETHVMQDRKSNGGLRFQGVKDFFKDSTSVGSVLLFN